MHETKLSAHYGEDYAKAMSIAIGSGVCKWLFGVDGVEQEWSQVLGQRFIEFLEFLGVQVERRRKNEGNDAVSARSCQMALKRNLCDASDGLK